MNSDINYARHFISLVGCCCSHKFLWIFLANFLAFVGAFLCVVPWIPSRFLYECTINQRGFLWFKDLTSAAEIERVLAHKAYFQLIFQLPDPIACQCHLLLAQHKSSTKTRNRQRARPGHHAYRFPQPQLVGYNGGTKVGRRRRENLIGKTATHWKVSALSFFSSFLWLFCKPSQKNNPTKVLEEVITTQKSLWTRRALRYITPTWYLILAIRVQ